jgi:putative ABC transport system ATP-binding protein
MPDAEPAILATDLVKEYPSGDAIIRGLDGVSLSLGRGEMVAVTGPSGSGKSTLVHLLAGFDEPDAGTVRIAGVDLRSLDVDGRARFRRQVCGLVGQSIALLPQATAAENVELPLLLEGVAAAERADRVARALEQVGLAGDGAKLPDQLSAGQQQRVAIARALVTRPSVLLADEPTASLDSANAASVTGLLKDASLTQGVAVLLVTHDPAVAGQADRILRLQSGKLEPEEAHAGRLR